jgi:hypothetical protein
MQFANKKHFRVPIKDNIGLYLLAQNLYRLQAFQVWVTKKLKGGEDRCYVVWMMTSLSPMFLRILCQFMGFFPSNIFFFVLLFT